MSLLIRVIVRKRR
ncbi:hypothetical protein MTR67_041316 [Solanum verrucosum]|uniref:Uncharacterized protein n=1 Tax=Solanum verrucosum TaxID=315347 RepID=A0AAF0UM25_SOLVR|nr:hypothetical protein MTR67_041316 [Solanum verrucosum]